MDRLRAGDQLSGRLLVVTAVAAERDALAGISGLDVVVGGVGPAESGAATADLLATGEWDAVVCAGIGGGFPPAVAGDVAVAARIVFADLGAETASGFVPASELGFGAADYEVPTDLSDRLAGCTGARLGSILTVATVTGTAASAEQLRRRHPDAVAEGMEGAGVAAAARRRGMPSAEIRTISNPVGPRDRGSWRVPEALHALRGAMTAVAEEWS